MYRAAETFRVYFLINRMGRSKPEIPKKKKRLDRAALDKLVETFEEQKLKKEKELADQKKEALEKVSPYFENEITSILNKCDYNDFIDKIESFMTARAAKGIDPGHFECAAFTFNHIRNRLSPSIYNCNLNVEPFNGVMALINDRESTIDDLLCKYTFFQTMDDEFSKYKGPEFETMLITRSLARVLKVWNMEHSDLMLGFELRRSNFFIVSHGK